MLPEDAFMRRLPLAIPLKQRLEFDALVTAADTAEAAYLNVHRVVTAIDKEPPGNLGPARTADLAVNTWAAVDNLHTWRQFARGVPAKPNGVLASFLDKTKVLTKMRNAMDHRAGNLNNLAAAKGFVHPVYGVVGFLSPFRDSSSWEIQFVTLGVMHHDQHNFPWIDPKILPVADDVSHISLTAFDYQVDLSEVVSELDAVMVAINRNVQVSAVPQITDAANAAGKDPAALLGLYSGTMRIALKATIS